MYEALLAFRSTLRRFLHFAEEGARSEGLTPQQHQVLLAVKGQPGKEWASITEIADALQIRHNTAVGLAARCEAAGLVRRLPNPNDRRQVQVTLTEKGEAILARLVHQNRYELQRLLEVLQTLFASETGA